jgi:hypothetical protein
VIAVALTKWPWRRAPVPPSLRAALDPDERILAIAWCTDGRVLAASRFGLWTMDDTLPQRWGWHLISKARLTGEALVVTVAEVIGQLSDGTQILIDMTVLDFQLAELGSLTDVVHARVRRSVAASRYLPWLGGGGWVVLRRVPGQDGVTRQVRLDPGADAATPGFEQAIGAVADDLAEDYGSG